MLRGYRRFLSKFSIHVINEVSTEVMIPSSNLLISILPFQINSLSRLYDDGMKIGKEVIACDDILTGMFVIEIAPRYKIH